MVVGLVGRPGRVGGLVDFVVLYGLRTPLASRIDCDHGGSRDCRH